MILKDLKSPSKRITDSCKIVELFAWRLQFIRNCRVVYQSLDGMVDTSLGYPHILFLQIGSPNRWLVLLHKFPQGLWILEHHPDQK